MNKEQFDKLAEILTDKGYRKYIQKWHHEDYVFGKGFYKDTNQWEENRNCYQILLSIYDYTLPHSFDDRLPVNQKNHVGIEVHIDVSRTIDERCEMILPWHDDTTIKGIEDAAENFYQFVCKQWPVPRKEYLV